MPQKLPCFFYPSEPWQRKEGIQNDDEETHCTGANLSVSSSAKMCWKLQNDDSRLKVTHKMLSPLHILVAALFVTHTFR